VVGDAVADGRAACARGAWGEAFALLSAADQESPFGAEDLERLAIAAHLIGRDEDSEDAWARAHREWLRCGETGRAVRCAFWLGLGLQLRGEIARVQGWLARARRLIEHLDPDAIEWAYVLGWEGTATMFQGDDAGACAIYDRAAEIADRGRDPDLEVFSRLGRGQTLTHLGDVAEGMALLDEAMVAVTASDVSPILAGLAYCIVILECQQAFDLRRAQEWTAALSRWCAAQADLVPYRGQCLVHRAEIMRRRGDWSHAMDEVLRARARLSEPSGQNALGMALYEQAEQHRLRGEFARAEAVFFEAGECGRDPQPGLALLRLAQGRVDTAVSAIRRALDEPAAWQVTRAELLAACVEIELAAGDAGAARAYADELGAIAARLDAPMLDAMAAHASGAVLLVEGEAGAALRELRRAGTTWHQLQSPYEEARVRVLLGLACRTLGDADSAAMELSAARAEFARLGAVPDVARVDGLLHREPPATGGLTERERQVLALIATGKTNRAVAAELVISEKTVARHVSNIFTKLGVSSRAAATAYAYEHDLV
jgi:ATP/maltotriose-dependent transcriptional regulator MalT